MLQRILSMSAAREILAVGPIRDGTHERRVGDDRARTEVEVTSTDEFVPELPPVFVPLPIEPDE